MITNTWKVQAPRRKGVLCVAGMLAFSTACERVPERAAGPLIGAQVEIPAMSRPFYYYQGSPIYLAVDSERLAVASEVLPAASAVADALTQSGVQVKDVEPLPQAHGHWLVHVGTGTSTAAATAAVGRLRADPRFAFATTAFRTVGGNADVVLLNRLAVQFRPGVSRSSIDSLNAALGTRVVRPPRPDSGFAEYWLAYPSGSGVDPLAIAATYDRHPSVLWADPDRVSDYRQESSPNDPYYPFQYFLKNPTTLNGVPVDDNVELAWNLTLGGGVPSSGGITVAVIDDGIAAGHEDLGGRVTLGYDEFGNNTSPCSDCAYSPFGNDSHGTSAAGIIGAEQNNGLGVSGVAPAVNLMAVRIFRNDQSASACQIGDGIDFAWHFGADVISNSWGGGSPDNCITNAINAAATSGRSGLGSLVVFAAGNTSCRSCFPPVIGAPTWQAQLSNVLSVGAIDRNGALTDYTPEGSGIGVVAPSGHNTGRCIGDVVTTDLMGAPGCSDGPGMNVNYSSTFSGTSAAAPQVSGVGALLYSLHASLTSAQAIAQIRQGADGWGPSTQYGAGKVDALFTIAPLGVAISGPTDITQAGTYTWTANPSGGTGNYTYQWQLRNVGSNTWLLLGTGQSQSRNVTSSTPDFYIGVTVTSAWRSVFQSVVVTNELNGGGGCGPCSPTCKC